MKSAREPARFGDSRLPVRFWDKCTPDNGSGCWQWIGATRGDGYGVIGIGPRRSHKTWRAHRLSYEALVGPVPGALVIDHLCRNRACVNPDHLEPVTSGENLRRGREMSPTPTHCTNGHSRTPENRYARPDRPGADECRQCRLDRMRLHYADKRRAPHLAEVPYRDAELAEIRARGGARMTSGSEQVKEYTTRQLDAGEEG